MNSPKTLLKGGPLDGSVVEIVFNPTARVPFFKKEGSVDWNDVGYAEYILTTEKSGNIEWLS